MKVLLIGDIFGRIGREAIDKILPKLKNELKPNIIIINGENSANGRGITEKIYKTLMSHGVSVVTMGNHTYGNANGNELLKTDCNIIRPANLNDELPGVGYKTINYNGKKVTVVNLIGSVNMQMPRGCPFKDVVISNPFDKMDEILKEIKSDHVIVDFHGEVTSEKIAFSHDFDGKVDIIVGTHTHVPTADTRRMPKGTIYQTDLGMVGSIDGVIGVKKDVIINRFRKREAGRNEVCLSENFQLNGLFVDLTTKKFKRINLLDKL